MDPIPNRLSHVAKLKTVSASRPGSASSSENVRPRIGVTRARRKNDGVTLSVVIEAARPFWSIVVRPTQRNNACSSKTSVCRRYSM